MIRRVCIRSRPLLTGLFLVALSACVPGRQPASPPPSLSPIEAPPAPSVAPAEPATSPPAALPPQPTVQHAPEPAAAAAAPELPAPAVAEEQGYESVATYYARRFDGRLTITDERYDPEKLTAATHDLPLGTLARVINPKNNREVVVRINDRPRKRPFPLIDLSRAAARELGFLGKGKIRVRVIPLGPAPPKPKARKAS